MRDCAASLRVAGEGGIDDGLVLGMHVAEIGWRNSDRRR